MAYQLVDRLNAPMSTLSPAVTARCTVSTSAAALMTPRTLSPTAS
jgi:hypothetical protein